MLLVFTKRVFTKCQTQELPGVFENGLENFRARLERRTNRVALRNTEGDSPGQRSFQPFAELIGRDHCAGSEFASR
eukprot:5962725-Pyramimonas_sp.AAC.2